MKTQVSTRALIAIATILLFLTAAALGASGQQFIQGPTITGVSNQNTTAIAVGSLRGTAINDLVVAEQNQICVYLSNGDGTFQPASCFGSGASQIAISAFGGGGHANIIALQQGSIFIYQGDGAGNFLAPKSFTGLSGDILTGPFFGTFGLAEVAAVGCGGTSPTSSIETLAVDGTIKTFPFSGCGKAAGVGVFSAIFPTDNDLLITGAANGGVGGGGLFDPNNNFQPFNLCNPSTPKAISPDGLNIVVYDGNAGAQAATACVQQGPSSTTLGTVNFPQVISGQDMLSLAPITVNVSGVNQTGLLGVLKNPSALIFVYSTDGTYINATQTGTIFNNIVNPSIVAVGALTSAGTQDIAVLSDSGLTVFYQNGVAGSVSPASLTFPPQILGTQSAPQVVTVSNPNTISILPLSVALTGSADFSESNDCGTTGLAAGLSCHVNVTYLPGIVETGSSGTLSITAANLVPLFVPLTGTEVPIAVPALDQASLNFGNQIVNTTSPGQSVKLSNTGTGALAITNITAVAPFAETDTCGISLAANATCVVSVTFDPTASSPATSQVTFTYAGSTTISMQQVSLSGTGVTLPVVTTEPLSQSILLGNPVTFTIAATGTAPLTFAWMKNGASVGGNSSSLTFTPVATDNGASIICVVSNAFGNATSTPAILTVDFVPTITTPLINTAVVLGQATNFSVAATGTTPLMFAWTKNGAAIGSNSSMLTFTPIAADAGAQVSVTVTNTFGSASSSATLTVNFPPTISVQPASQTIISGNPVTFFVTASGTGILSYVWSKNSSPINGATASSFTYTPAPSDDGAKFTVTVSNLYGSAVSSSATLTLLFPPTIQTQPRSVAVPLGTAASFSVAASGSAPLTFSWSKAGLPVGTNSPNYTTTATVAGDDGAAVNVVISNAAGRVTSNNAVLTIEFPVVITTQPVSVTVLAGSTAAWSVAATGTNNQYQWQKNGINVGTNSPNYSFVATASDKNAQILCVVSNAFGPSQTSNTVALTVNVPPGISAQTASALAVAPNGTVSFSVTATGDASLTFQWFHGVTAIAGATSSTFTTPALQAADDNTSYHGVVSNAFGQAPTKLWVVQVIQPPAIVTQPADVTISNGQSTTLSVVASVNDNAPLTYSWQQFGLMPLNPIPGAISPTLTVSPTDNTNYAVTVTDIAGNVTSRQASVSVLGGIAPFSITLGPSTQTIKAGDAVSYQVAVVDNVTALVGLVCQTNVPGGSCTLSKNSSGTGQVNAVVQTPTTALTPQVKIIWPWLGLILATALAFAMRPRYRRLVPAFAMAAVLIFAGCGGGSAQSASVTPPPPPPPPVSHSYTVTVLATMPGVVSQQATSILVVTH